MAEKWRWFDQPKHNDPGIAAYRLAIDDGSSFGGRTILECGNLDPEAKDRIAAVPQLIEACEQLRKVWADYMAGDGENPLDYGLEHAVFAVRFALADARGEKPDE